MEMAAPWIFALLMPPLSKRGAAMMSAMQTACQSLREPALTVYWPRAGIGNLPVTNLRLFAAFKDCMEKSSSCASQITVRQRRDPERLSHD